MNSIVNNDFGQVIFENRYFYILVDKNEQSSLQNQNITITLNKLYSDYSYMVLIGDALESYHQNVPDGSNPDVPAATDPSYINGLIEAGKKAFRATNENNLTMTFPISFVDNLAYFDIALEGFNGYSPICSNGPDFMRIYLIDDARRIPDYRGNIDFAKEDFTFTFGENTVSKNDQNNIFNGDYEVYMFLSANYADLKVSGQIDNNNQLILNSFSYSGDYSLFIHYWDDTEQIWKYKLLSNLDKLPIMETEYGQCAQIYAFFIINPVDGNRPSYIINIGFADNNKERPAVEDFTVVSNSITFSTMPNEGEIQILWDGYKNSFYAMLPNEFQLSGNNYLTITSCSLSSNTSLILKGFNENGEFVFSSGTEQNFGIIGFGNNPAACIYVYDATTNELLYRIALVFDNNSSGGSEIGPDTVIYNITVGNEEFFFYPNMTGEIIQYVDYETQEMYYYVYIGADKYTENAETFTIDLFYGYEEGGPIKDYFTDTEIDFSIDTFMATNVTLKIGEFNNNKCVALKLSGDILLYIYLADAPQA